MFTSSPAPDETESVAAHEGPVPGQAAFKDAMSELASGVSLLTVRLGDPAVDHGMTVTSLASASLNPPMVTVGIGRATSLAPALTPGMPVGISILGHAQQQLATEFSRKGRPPATEIFGARAYHRGTITGALLADEALATMEGSIVDVIAAGDHLVVLIEILAAHAHGRADSALSYHRRGYTRT